MIKTCLFDLDGTLLNTLSTIAYYANGALRSFGIEPITTDEARLFIGNGADTFIDRIFKKKGISDPVLYAGVLKEYKDAYDREPLYMTEPYGGIRELLEALTDNGIKICVLSNKPDIAVRGIINHFFPKIRYVRGARADTPLKPDPTAALELLASMGASSSETAVIGDSPEDIYTARNLGAALKIGVSWGFRDTPLLKEAGADTVVDDPTEIISEVLKR